jgi:hypothetical protein
MTDLSDEPNVQAGQAASPAPAGQAVVCVRGEATVEADPEIVLLSVSVSARARDRAEALGNLSRRNEEFLVLVRSYGPAIEKIETSHLSVYPELRRGREERARWYRGTVRTRLTVADFPVAGELVGRISDMELCTIDGPWWQLRASSPVYREARITAAKAAVTRAAEYAAAVGSRLSGLIELADVGLGGQGRPVRTFANARLHEASSGPEDGPVVIDLEPETQIVQASVEARFTMTQPASLDG